MHFNGLPAANCYHKALHLGCCSSPRPASGYVWWHCRLIQNFKENWLLLSKMTWGIWQIFVHRLKNSNFILEAKMAELNQNKNSKQPDRLDTVWKLYFNLEINEYHN